MIFVVLFLLFVLYALVSCCSGFSFDLRSLCFCFACSVLSEVPVLKLILGGGHLPDPCLVFLLPGSVPFVGWFPCWLKVNCPMLFVWSFLEPCPVL